MREYSKNHYRNNLEKYKAKANRNRKKVIDRNRSLVEKLKESPCKDCGKSYPSFVMDFDHLDSASKIECVSRMMGCKTDTILKEISKCDLVCSNCHRVRTHERNSYAGMV